MKSNLDNIGSIASIIGAILAVIQLFLSADWQLRVSLILVFIFIVLLIIYRIESKSYQKYLTALTEVQNLHYEIIKDQSGYNGLDLDKSIIKLSETCTEISKILTKLKGSLISVCVKYTNALNEDYNGMYVKTLSRDYEANRQRKNLYSESVLDKISDNTDFEELFVKIINKVDWKEVYFFANYLPQKHQYNNSHLDKSIIPDELFSWISRNNKWPLPYKSTIVVPIISGANKNIYGYLCVDSPKNNGFNLISDVKIVQDIALDLSQTIKTISEKHLISNKLNG